MEGLFQATLWSAVEEEQEAAFKDTQLCQWQRAKIWDLGWAGSSHGGCRGQGWI